MEKGKFLSTTGLALVAVLGLSACDDADREQASEQVEEAAEATQEAGRDAAEYTREKADEAGDYIGDATVTTRVKAALLDDDRVSGMDINVETQDGVVQLSGFVENAAEIAVAAAIAADVEGVKSVENDIEVRN